MIQAALLALCVWAPEPQDAAGRALSEARFAEALALYEEVADPARRARGRASVFYSAGDPVSALGAAAAGLQDAPEDLELLHRAISSALWMADGPRAREYTGRLAEALPGASLTAEQRPAWEEALTGFRHESELLERGVARREAAVGRARGASLGLLGAALVGLFFLARAGR